MSIIIIIIKYKLTAVVFDLVQVQFKDLLAAFQVRQVHAYLNIKPSRS